MSLLRGGGGRAAGTTSQGKASSQQAHTPKYLTSAVNFCLFTEEEVERAIAKQLVHLVIREKRGNLGQVCAEGSETKMP